MRLIALTVALSVLAAISGCSSETPPNVHGFEPGTPVAEVLRKAGQPTVDGPAVGQGPCSEDRSVVRELEYHDPYADSLLARIERRVFGLAGMSVACVDGADRVTATYG